MSTHERQQGFSLLEIMITVFVIAVGLLSIAGLQAIAKKSNFDSIQRTTAAALAQDLIERIRANPGQGAAYVTDATNGISASNAPAAPGVDCSTGSASSRVCTPAQLVAFDRYQWSQALLGRVEMISSGSGPSATTDYVGGLSEPTACVVNATAPCGLYTITLVWRGITPQPLASAAEAGTAVSTSCGANNTAYVPTSSADSDKTLRRVLVVQTVIDDRSGSCS